MAEISSSTCSKRGMASMMAEGRLGLPEVEGPCGVRWAGGARYAGILKSHARPFCYATSYCSCVTKHSKHLCIHYNMRKYHRE